MDLYTEIKNDANLRLRCWRCLQSGLTGQTSVETFVNASKPEVVFSCWSHGLTWKMDIDLDCYDASIFPEFPLHFRRTDKISFNEQFELNRIFRHWTGTFNDYLMPF